MPRVFRAFLSRLFRTLYGGYSEVDLDEEIRQHIEMLREDFRRRGMNRSEADFAARRQFGHVNRLKEDLRRRRTLPTCAGMFQAAKVAARTFRRAKIGAFAAVTTLSMAIGASIATFAVLQAVVLRPLPFPESENLLSFGVWIRVDFPTPHLFPT